MRLAITTASDTWSIEVASDMELMNFMALCENEAKISIANMLMTVDGKSLIGATRTLAELEVKDGDMVMVVSTAGISQGTSSRVSPPASDDPPPLDFKSIKVPAHLLGKAKTPTPPSSAGSSSSPQNDPNVLHDLLVNNPEHLNRLNQTNPRLAEAARKSLDEFKKVFEDQHKAQKEEERKRIKLLTADPFDMEAQQLIQDEINKKNIDANMEAAMEYSPESFGTVQMLYINCSVNGHHVKAFVDSGAQMTIMSVACAERCGIMRLADTRWSGVAKGVGEQKIIGRVHCTTIEVGGTHLTSAFSILQDQSMEMLLGLDLLKRHQMIIDLNENVLKIGTSGTQTNFLSCADLPDDIKLTNSAQEKAVRESEEQARADEDKQLAETLAASISEEPMETSEEVSTGAVVPGTAMEETVPELEGGSDAMVVSELVANGFSREEVLEALTLHNGDKSEALSYLIGKKFGFT